MDGAALDDRTLRRIIALLAAFAVLAERTAHRSFPVRWLVLTLLRHVERVARNFVVETTQWEWPGLDGDLEPGTGAMDAALLGLRLRLLAAVFGVLLSPEDPVHGNTAHIDGAPTRDGATARRFHVALSRGWTLIPYDTS
ncbi:MAG: hypothetical protein ACK4U0_21500 [Mesorhizobium sp.]